MSANLRLEASDSQRGKEASRRVLLELHAPDLREGESVRVSGSTVDLGEWNVHRSKPLTKRNE